jgi:hypothetical protein
MSGVSSRLFGLNTPRAVSPYLSLNAPITRETLATLKQRLASVRHEYPPELDWPISGHVCSEEDRRPRAAVLVPLCNVNGRPGLLLEVRGKLRSHGGEVRCEK